MNDGAISITLGSTDNTFQIKLRNATTGALEPGLTVTDLNIDYIRVESDNDVTIAGEANMTDLGSLTASHTDNGAFEVGHGYYRIDVPDAAFALGAVYGSIIITHDNDTVLPATIDWQRSSWDEILTAAVHNISTSAGRRLRDLATSVIITGTSPDTSGTTNTSTLIELDNDASSDDGAYDPANIAIVNGTGMGQSRQIFEYTGATKLAYVNRDWKVVPDSTSEYVISTSTGDTHVNEGKAQGGGTNTITLNALASGDDDVYISQVVFIVAGTGADQNAIVLSYNGTTKVATIHKDWIVEPDATSIYAMLPLQSLSASQITAANTGSPSLR